MCAALMSSSNGSKVLSPEQVYRPEEWLELVFLVVNLVQLWLSMLEDYLISIMKFLR